MGWQKRPILLENYNKLIKQFKTWMKEERYNMQYKHITDEQVKQLTTHMNDESNWLTLKMEEHAALVKSAVPPFFAETISKRLDKTKSAFEKIKTTPKPVEKKKDMDYEKSGQKNTENKDFTNDHELKEKNKKN